MMGKLLKVAMVSGIVIGLLLGGNIITVDAQNVQIDSSADDANERGTGVFSSTGTVLSIYSHTDPANNNYRCAGLRFNNIPINQGDEIENAYLELYFSNQNDVNMFIYAENTDNALDFVANPNIIDNVNRPRTDNYVAWIENGLSINTWDNSDNIAGMIQEIVNRPGWEAGNSITILLIANTDQNLLANIRSYDFSSALGAKLHFHWQPTIDGTNYPVRAMPGGVVTIRQILQSHGQGATDITAKITFNHENFRFLSDYPENDITIENCNGGENVCAEWYVSTPTAEDNYEFFVEWEFIHEDYHTAISDNFTIEVKYFVDPTPHTIPVFLLSDDGLTISIVAIGLAVAALAFTLLRMKNGNNNEGQI